MLHFYDAIPPELWLKILSFLDDFASLYSFALASTRQRTLVSQHSPRLHFNICLNLGYTAEHSYGSSKTIYPNQPPAQILPTGDLDAALRVAKTNQKTMIKSAFADVNDWENFASVKHSITRNWHSGACKMSVAVTIKSDAPAVWRWKFDPDLNYWATTTQQGGLRVGAMTEVPGRHRKWISSSSQPFSHLESSGPFLITTSWQNEFLIWRRRDSAFSSALPTSARPSGPELHNMSLPNGWLFALEQFTFAPLFELQNVVHPPVTLCCFKARAPYLVAGSSDAQTMYVWELETGKLVEEYNVSDRESDEMNYIELDQHYIFLCSNYSLAVYDRQSQQHVHDFSLNGPGWGYYSMPSEWVAVHHDVQGGHLLALSRGGKLFWTCRYSEEVKGKAGDFVVLDMGGGGVHGHNLCVENGRAVISMEVGELGLAAVERVFLLTLRTWTSLADFGAAAPSLMVLLNFVPSLHLSTRIEMDSCGVYITSSGIVFERENALLAHWACLNKGGPPGLGLDLPSRLRWLDPGGNVICSQPVLSSSEQRSSEDEWTAAVDAWIEAHHQWHESSGQAATAILKLSFVDEPGKNKDQEKDGEEHKVLGRSYDEEIDLSGWSLNTDGV